MGVYELNLHIDTASFPEIGGPFYAPADKVKIPRKDKADYDGYRQSCNIALPSAVSDLNTLSSFPGFYQSVSNDIIDMKLKFSDDASKTYTFIGMDIDEDFNAVIKLGSGHVIVGSMFDRDKVYEELRPITDWLSSKVADVVNKEVKKAINTIDESVVRKIVTSLKTGSFYSLSKKFSKNFQDSNDYSSAYSDFIEMIKKDISADSESAGSSGTTLGFSSIILNLIGDKEEQLSKVASQTVGDTDIADKSAKAFFGCLLAYWSRLSKVYCHIHAELAAIDLWSDMNKRVLGEREFNSRFYSCAGVHNNATGETLDTVISFSGVAKNGGVADDNVIRDRAASQLGLLSRSLLRATSRDLDDLDFEEILRSNLDTSDIEDVYSLTSEEMQALSVLDSLRYIDEDAASVRASYDMDDPEQRGLFVKSAIRSYERNFREFKPVRNYDVTEALANMVERGDIESNPVVSQEVVSDEPGSDMEVGDIVTTKAVDLKTLVDKDSLVKVLKLVNKACTKVSKYFVENT